MPELSGLVRRTRGAESLETGKRLGHVPPPHPEPEIIPRIPELRGGQDQHPLLFHQLLGEAIDVGPQQLRKGRAARARSYPAAPRRVALEERIEQLEIRAHDPTVAREHRVSRAQRDERENLARRAI